MNTIQIIIIAFLIVVLIKRFLPVKGINYINTDELKTVLSQKDKQFIDVRTRGEFSGNHITGFKNIPLFELTNEVKKLNKDKEVIVICQSGNRSLQACRILKRHGFNHITNVNGGMINWH